MLNNYFPILIFLGLSLVVGLVALLSGALLGPKKTNPAKLSPYECGFDASEDSRLPFDVRYYLVAILFILFDLETAFLFPWAISIHRIGLIGFAGMMVFLIILLVGFIYEWRKGALEWE